MSHLTLEERQTIELSLNNSDPLNVIADAINKSRSTVSREIRKHLFTDCSGAYGRCFNDCIYRANCSHTGMCIDHPECVSKRCCLCSDCRKVCPEYKKELCAKLDLPPYVCNGCPDKARCRLEKKFYRAAVAQKEYSKLLKESREGFNLTEEELLIIDALISELIKNGQSIAHILQNEKNIIEYSESTLRRLVRSGALKARNIDLPRQVRFRPRKSKAVYKKIDKKCRINRTYEDFRRFCTEHPEISITEMDTVEGKKGGAVLLTIIFRNCGFMLAFRRERNTAQSVIDCFKGMYEKLGEEVYKKLFAVILTDNGTEFSNPSEIEIQGEEKISSIFYCDPSSPYEKGRVENNHEFIQRIIPKGYSMNCYSQEDINKMMSHINSYGRPMYNGRSPAEIFVSMYGETVLHLLGQELIPKEKIILKPSLLK